MSHSETDLVALIERTVALKPRGKELVGHCPFHGDRRPSLSVNPTKQLWRCWSCGIGGAAPQWLMHLHQLSYPQAKDRMRDERITGCPEKPVDASVDPRLPEAQRRLDVIGTELRQALDLAARRSDFVGRYWDRAQGLYERQDRLRYWMDQREPGGHDWPD